MVYIILKDKVNIFNIYNVQVVLSSYRLSTVSIVSFPVGLGPARAGLVGSRHKVVPVCAPVGADTTALPPVPVPHVAEHPLELLAVLRLRVAEHLGQRVPGAGQVSRENVMFSGY